MMRTKTVKILNLKIATKNARARIREEARQEYLAGATIYGTARKLHVTAQTVANWFIRFRKAKGEQFTDRKRGPASGTGGLLGEGQQRQLSKVLTDKTPDQLKFDFALWSSKAIKEYVKEVFHVEMSRRTARRYMNRLGFTYKCPERRFREQSPRPSGEFQAKSILISALPSTRKRKCLKRMEIIYLNCLSALEI